MSIESSLQDAFFQTIETLRPSFFDIRRDVQAYRDQHPTVHRSQQASDWADGVCRRFAIQGAVMALPGAIPGLGWPLRLFTETGILAADLSYMLRCMAHITAGVAMHYERDPENEFQRDLVAIMGEWSGITRRLVRPVATRIVSKVALSQILKRLWAPQTRPLGSRVGSRVVTKLGINRAGAAAAKWIPLGAGVVLGAGLNHLTMNAFKQAAIAYYENLSSSDPADAASTAETPTSQDPVSQDNEPTTCEKETPGAEAQAPAGETPAATDPPPEAPPRDSANT